MLLVPASASVPEHRAEALLQHEIGTHVVTYVNGSRATAPPARRRPRRLRRRPRKASRCSPSTSSAASTRAGCASSRHASSPCTRCSKARLPRRSSTRRRRGDRGRRAHAITMRVFRSGGLTKDVVYLRGLPDLLAYLAAGEPLDTLWLGKMPLDLGPAGAVARRARRTPRTPPRCPATSRRRRPHDRLALSHPARTPST